MDTQTQIERLIELAIVQRTELKQLVEQLPQLREHLNAEVERTIEEVEPQLRAELEEFCDKRAVDANAKVGSALEAKIVELSKALELTTQARYNAIKEQERKVEELRQLAAKQIEGHVAALPEAVKEIVGAELARFPRAGEIDQLRKEFAEPRGLNPRGKWLPIETYNKLDLVTWNGDSYVSNIDGNRERPARNSSTWTLSAARGIGGGGPSDLSALTAVPSNGSLLIGSGTSWVNGNIVAGAGINVTNGAGSITISATDGDITLDDGTAASPSLHFTNDADTGIYRPAANTLGISVSGTQVAYFDQNGLTIPNAGIEAGGSLHAANGNANNPSLSFTSDQDTGFFRHQPNELGVALGGTQYATLTSTTFSVTPALSVAGVSRVTNSTASTSTSTGALVVTGGVGIGGAANVGGNLTVSGTGTSSVAGNVSISSSAANNATLTINNSNATSWGSVLTLSSAGSPFGYFGSNGAIFGSTDLTPTILAGSGLGFGVKVNNSSSASLSISSAGNTTLAGNLTVSASGTAYTDKLLRVLNGSSAALMTITGDGRTYLGADMGYNSVFTVRRTTGNAVNELANIGDADGLTLRFMSTATAYKLSLLGSTGTISFGNAGVSEQQLNLNTATGNLLLGTTTDSGNGKLQLAVGAADNTSGIGFGADTSLYRPTSGTVEIRSAAGVQSVLTLNVNGNNYGYFGQVAAAGGLVTGSSVGDVVLRSNTQFLFSTGGASLALKLDSSQNATFAGSTGVGLKNDSFLYFGATVRTAVKGNSTGNLDFYANNNLATTLDSSGNIIQKLNGTAPVLGTNSTMTFELTSNTSLTIKVRGSDGTTRSVALTLA